MTSQRITTLFVSLVVAGLAVLGLSAPAQAAPLNGQTVTSSALIGTSGTNATTVVVTATAVTGSPANMLNVTLPTGWTFVDTSSCTPATVAVTGYAPLSCQKLNLSAAFVTLQNPTTPFTAGQAVTVTFGIGSLNVGNSRVFTVDFANSNAGGASVDTGTATLAGGVTNSTVTFDANGGSGTVAAQTGSAAAALTTNVFTRDGYTFNGWNTSADGTGTGYADGASYAFSASTTLYAQWNATLANTGFDGMPYLTTGGVLALAGAVIVLFARRRQSS